MNINKLYIGQSFKNYKEMCAELGWEIKSSTNSKNSQFTELATYCKFSKMGHKITIEEVYDKPIDRVDNRGKSQGSRNNNNVYGDIIQLLILDLLAQRKDRVLTISRSKLLLTINMINNNFSPCNQHTKGLSKLIDVRENVIYDFYNSSNSNFKSSIETALANLHDKRIIWYADIVKVKEKGSQFHRIATDDENDIIRDCENEVLKELGYEKVSLVRISKDWRLFRSKVNSLIKESSEIDYHYNAYKISPNDKYLEEERIKLISFILDATERNEIKGNLNALVCENILKNADKRQSKSIIKSEKLYRLDEDYLSDISELINLLINNSASYIVNHVMAEEDEIKLTESQFELIEQLFA